MKNPDSSDSNIYISYFGIAGVTKHYAIAFIAIVPYIISAFAINRRRKVEPNNTHPDIPTPKKIQFSHKTNVRL